MMVSMGNCLKAAVLAGGLFAVAGVCSSPTGRVAAGWSKATSFHAEPHGGSPALKNDGAVKKAIRGIHSDLKKLKLEFFQLRYIENAKVYNNEFRYTAGLQQDSKINGPTFLKYGCDIYVHVQYPATRQDMDQTQLKGDLVPLKNGSAYGVWRLTRTESTPEGQAFAEKVDQIVTARLDAMKKELEQD
jgi:hypothetical protein